MEKFDVAVIGGGPGGYPAAIRAAQLGASVALIEKEALGGTCLNHGCIPTKTLIAASDLLEQIKRSEKFGLRPGKVEFDYGVMCRRKDEVVTKLGNGLTQLLKSNGIKVFDGAGSFVSRRRIAVGKAAGNVIDADNTIIATGSASVVPSFAPKAETVVESRAFLARKKLPADMIVLGGGVIGCEFACMAAQLGVKVTVVEMLEDILVVLDPDVRRELRHHMEKELGISILVGKPLTNIGADKNGVAGKFGNDLVRAELLLVAVGRRPVTDGLGLDQVGLMPSENGGIEIDEFCRTRIASIYAVGDVTVGSVQLAHAATSQGITAAENICSGKRRQAETIVPACIFTSPEIGSVGISEQKAKELGIAHNSGKFAFAGMGKALASGETSGFVKWIADSRTDQLLGAQAIGPRATELIAEAALAIRSELTLAELGRAIHCHPTFAEAWMEAAHAARGECIHAPAKKK